MCVVQVFYEPSNVNDAEYGCLLPTLSSFSCHLCTGLQTVVFCKKEFSSEISRIFRNFGKSSIPTHETIGLFEIIHTFRRKSISCACKLAVTITFPFVSSKTVSKSTKMFDFKLISHSQLFIAHCEH